ncbi:hypothetical protein HF086_012787 [Spodoptera exigua]|uniref:DUF4371 domain-containing protein n=1 Tax=Spodoptera exigua TaxID=7107 RepID=A0A922ML39_SPOEX|nr:hypothetical protein HF086_012787 [Spodoptera exigua]
MFDIIKFLAKQNLALRGHIENDTSTNRGNFLELVHLIAKYDPVLREHLVRSKMCGKISIPYMSPQIQNEFIAILGNNVRQHIIGQIKKAKYYSIIFDSTPDLSHKDQTSQVLRYVVIENEEVNVVESFIDFIETKDKTAEGISNMILNKLQTDDLDISNCRGQAYDNAAVMAGKHSGVQQRIKNPKVEFVPCSNHSLNLVCLHAASVEGLDLRLCAQKVNALQIILIEKREEWADCAVSYAKNMCEELGISIEPRRIRRKHIFDDGSRDADLSCENKLRRKLFSSLDRIIVEIRERFQQLQKLTDKFAYLSPAILLDPDDTKCNLDYASVEIDEQDFMLERHRLRTFVAATGNENKLINADSLELLKFIVKSKLEDALPNILIMLRIFFTVAISNASCERRLVL